MTSSLFSSESTSTSLLKRARQHESEAWQKISDLYGPLVYGWARQAGLQASDAADLGQEVFRVVAARIDSFRHEQSGGSFRGWLWGITKNKLKEHFRRQTIGAEGAGGTAAMQRLQEITSSLPSDSVELDHSDTRTTLMHRTLEIIRSEFEVKTWQAFWRSTIDEQKTADIAEELGMTTSAVRQAKYRVLRRLREDMDELG